MIHAHKRGGNGAVRRGLFPVGTGNGSRDTPIRATAQDTVRARRRRTEHIRSLHAEGPKRLDYFVGDIERAFGISLADILAQYAEIADSGALSEFIAAHAGDKFGLRQVRARLDPLAPHGFFAAPANPGDGTAEEAFQYILSCLGEPS